MDPCMMTEAELALDELRRAMDFLDRVRASSSDERAAVGSDHWDWLEAAARKVVEAHSAPAGEGEE